MNYVDVDPDTGVARDFTCGKRSYEGHKGTDIAIRSMYELEQGVSVRASARGTVLRLRDGEEDIFKNAEEMQATRDAGKECGNGIIIDHGEGWLTQYCHLKQGSIKVKQGDKVGSGQKIAQVGMSGITAHPHVHLSVLFEGKHVDPYTGLNKDAGCTVEGTHSLWRSSTMLYEPFALYDAGFIDSKPDFKAITKGERGAPLSLKSPALVFWSAYFGAKPDDKIKIKVTDPKGNVLEEREIIQKSTKARQYYFIGKKRPAEGWKRGTYKATISVSRMMNGEYKTQTMQKAADLY